MAGNYVEEHQESQDFSEAAESSSEDETIDETVKEDMVKLEESFKEHGMRFRLINRIGEGASAQVPHSLELQG